MTQRSKVTIQTDETCNGVGALGPCDHKALYILIPAPLRRKSDSRFACGLHMAQLVKQLIPQWGLVAVGAVWKP